MIFPDDVLAKLKDPALVIHVGDVWWIPNQYLDYPRRADHFGLIVALERSPDKKLARVHIVVGSTKQRGGSELVVTAGEAGLREQTYFRFWRSCQIDPVVLVTVGKHRGRLDISRLEEIRQAILTSRLGALRRLVR